MVVEKELALDESNLNFSGMLFPYVSLVLKVLGYITEIVTVKAFLL